ncbi:MBL fold metallo-hydrolase [Anaerosalibacter massiliensis]|uniref:MBL fold metallo-hydrolase n=1 Tax=Anaerosalibacter massiliensis TaxID=1347392 RepID=A0A9X2ML79_9FIRM|nr:MBL fold metallo-hydrolase [Anaerosalibacter massiliensis]MCR2045192.1 MBL fold metallo-hydrolase [Anaerosalibacter massiliensis]
MITQDINTPKESIDFIPLEEGNKIEIGDYSFEVVDIPGHTPGHIGLYERDKKIFFCGDYVLDRITPNIAF